MWGKVECANIVSRELLSHLFLCSYSYPSLRTANTVVARKLGPSEKLLIGVV